ncbi:transposase [Wenzhouxiangella sp. EGI_FJ10305]
MNKAGSDVISQSNSPNFKGGAVRQVVHRGHSVAEVSGRLGMSSYSLYQ